MQQAAQEYADLGYSVIPIAAKKKNPLVKWTDYQHKRAGEDEIEAWWKQWPDANVGIICGEISGRLIVIDVDGPDNPWPERELDAGAVSTTGSGGRHYFMRLPEGVSIQNSAGKLAHRVDIRGDGGLVVVPPSIHESGNKYSWGVGLCEAADLPGLPQWVIDKLNRPDAPEGGAEGETDYAVMMRGVTKDTRNVSAAQLCGHFFGMGLPRPEVEIILRDWNERNDPPLSGAELGRVIDSIGKRQLMADSDLPPPHVTSSTDEQRTVWLEEVSECIKVKIVAARRICGDEAFYEFTVDSGDIAIVRAEDMASGLIFRRQITAAARRVPRLPKKKAEVPWEHLSEKLMAAAREVHPSDDATIEGQIHLWITGYFATHEIVDNGNADHERQPIRIKDGVWLNSPEFAKWIRQRFDYKVSGQKFAQLLNRFGFTRQKKRVRLADGKSVPTLLYRVPVRFIDTKRDEI